MKRVNPDEIRLSKVPETLPAPYHVAKLSTQTHSNLVRRASYGLPRSGKRSS